MKIEEIKKIAGDLLAGMKVVRKSGRRGEYNQGDSLETPLDVILCKRAKLATPEEKEFQEFNDNVLMTAILTKRQSQDIADVIPLLKIFNERKEYFRAKSELAKAMTLYNPDRTWKRAQ